MSDLNFKDYNVQIGDNIVLYKDGRITSNGYDFACGPGQGPFTITGIYTGYITNSCKQISFSIPIIRGLVGLGYDISNYSLSFRIRYYEPAASTGRNLFIPARATSGGTLSYERCYNTDGTYTQIVSNGQIASKFKGSISISDITAGNLGRSFTLDFTDVLKYNSGTSDTNPTLTQVTNNTVCSVFVKMVYKIENENYSDMSSISSTTKTIKFNPDDGILKIRQEENNFLGFDGNTGRIYYSNKDGSLYNLNIIDGDTINVNGLSVSGYLQADSSTIEFFIPVRDPICAFPSVDISNLGILIRHPSGQYLYRVKGSSAITKLSSSERILIKNSGLTVAATRVDSNGIYIRLTVPNSYDWLLGSSTTTIAAGNVPLSIYLGGSLYFEGDCS